MPPQAGAAPAAAYSDRSGLRQVVPVDLHSGLNAEVKRPLGQRPPTEAAGFFIERDARHIRPDPSHHKSKLANPHRGGSDAKVIQETSSSGRMVYPAEPDPAGVSHADACIRGGGKFRLAGGRVLVPILLDRLALSFVPALFAQTRDRRHAACAPGTCISSGAPGCFGGAE